MHVLAASSSHSFLSPRKAFATRANIGSEHVFANPPSIWTM